MRAISILLLTGFLLISSPADDGIAPAQVKEATPFACASIKQVTDCETCRSAPNLASGKEVRTSVYRIELNLEFYQMKERLQNIYGDIG